MGQNPTTASLSKASLNKAMKESSLAILLLSLGCLLSIAPVLGKPAEEEADGEEEEEGGDGEEEGCVTDEDTDYLGHDIPEIMERMEPYKVENQQACATLTGEKEGASFWTYRDSDKKCWLKSSKAGKKEHAGLVSGNIECGCVIDEETDYLGHDIGKAAKVKNQQACATLTGTKEGGLFWTYQASTKKCWVKTSKKGKTEGAGLVSGSIGCAVKETEE